MEAKAFPFCPFLVHHVPLLRRRPSIFPAPCKGRFLRRPCLTPSASIRAPILLSWPIRQLPLPPPPTCASLLTSINKHVLRSDAWPTPGKLLPATFPEPPSL